MSFAETILRIEAERMEEARQAIAAGWTPEDHPHKCCPKPEKVAPAPRKKAGLEWYAHRLWNAEARRDYLQAKLDKMDAKENGTRPDFGEINIPWNRRREREAEAAVKRGVEYVKTWEALESAKNQVARYSQRLEELRDAA